MVLTRRARPVPPCLPLTSSVSACHRAMPAPAAGGTLSPRGTLTSGSSTAFIQVKMKTIFVTKNQEMAAG